MIFKIFLCLIPVFIAQKGSAQITYDVILKNAANNTDLSLQCLNDIQKVTPTSLTFWIMVDSSSKVPPGLAKGNVFSLGNYDECLEIEDVETKFCPSSINLDLFFGADMAQVVPDAKDLNIGLYFCVLKSCTPQDLSIMFKNLVTFDDGCFSKDGKSLDALAIVAIIFFSIVGIITVLSTTYDVYLIYNELKAKHPLLTAFSLYSNGKKLFYVGGTQQMQSLNGIRAISTLWVVIGHVYMAYVFVPLDNYMEVLEWVNSTSSQYILAATVSVDTFLVIGGFLTIYTTQPKIEKSHFNIPLYYLHRYLRLTPALAAMVLAHVALLSYLGDGPVWDRTDTYLVEGCRNYWWSALLYVQNYVNPNGICVPQSWYLSVDMQLFLISPIILLVMKRWALWGYASLILASVLSMIASFLIGWYYNLSGQMTGNLNDNLTDFMTYYYNPTHTRLVPYLFGVMLGYAIHRIKNGYKIMQLNKFLVLSAWILALGVMAICIYGGHTIQTTEYDHVANSFYIAAMRPTWSIAICWVIFACVMDYGGPINAFLSLPVFQILSRLSYSIYLTHYAFIFMTNFSVRTPIHMSDYNAIHKFCGDLTFSIVISTLWTLIFESPVIVLEKFLLKGSKITL